MEKMRAVFGSKKVVGKSKSQAGVCKKSATDMKTKSQLKKLAWKFFSIWIKKRDKKKCYTCPATGCVKQNAQAGHYPPGSILPEREYFNEKLNTLNLNHFYIIIKRWI